MTVSLETIYRELKALRREVAAMVPVESVKDYAHPTRIVTAYKRATKKYPALSWRR